MRRLEDVSYADRGKRLEVRAKTRRSENQKVRRSASEF